MVGYSLHLAWLARTGAAPEWMHGVRRSILLVHLGSGWLTRFQLAGGWGSRCGGRRYCKEGSAPPVQAAAVDWTRRQLNLVR
jgi:hypothetical protein